MTRSTRLSVRAVLGSAVLATTAFLVWSEFRTERDEPAMATIPGSYRNVSGLTFDGSSLWITVEGDHSIRQVDPETGRVRRRFDFPVQATGGSAWDGSSLWQLAYEEKQIYRIDPATGRILGTIPSPGEGMCCGMASDGESLWVASFEDRKTYRIDPARGGAVLGSFDSPFESTGLAWDGRRLWGGILVGTVSHDEVTPATGFVREIDTSDGRTHRVLPVAGVGPGTTSWTPGSPTADRQWWFDGHHNQIVRIDLPGTPAWRPFAIAALGAIGIVGVGFGSQKHVAARSAEPAGRVLVAS